MSENSNNESWHLDKRVNVSLIMVMVIQVIAATFAYAQLTSQVAANTTDIIRSEERMNARMDRNYAEATKRYDRITEALIRIEDKLDQKVDK
jgi:hypothetical protein